MLSGQRQGLEGHQIPDTKKPAIEAGFFVFLHPPPKKLT
jgi:hypothetical protein